MAFAANLDYSNRMVSRLSLNQQQQQAQQPIGLHVDDEGSIDDSIETTMLSQGRIEERRDSYANSSANMFSPQSQHWDEFQAPALDRTQSLSNGTFFEPTNNHGFARPPMASFPHQPSWPLVDRPAEAREQFGSQAHDEFTSGDYEAGPHTYTPVGSGGPVYNAISIANGVRPSAVFPPSSGSDTPLSTSPDKWNPINRSETDPQPLSKRLRQHSPSRPFSPGTFPRRDGIRKKNARFEIPAERNLHTIDQLISEATNDEEIKELKQQKRLLRNRQAALDSRQRKKKHTEELEEEKKQWNDRFNMLETELEKVQHEREAVAAERAQWEQHVFQCQQEIQKLQFEKEDLITKHTLEAGELRKKVSFLAERLEKTQTTTATVTPAATDFTDFGIDMHGVAMEGEEWNNYILVDQQFPGEQDNSHSHAQQQLVSPPNVMPVATRSSKPQQQHEHSDPEKPVASGLLFMLLLCGAFVASKGSTTVPPILRMPEDVRAASATVLDNLLKDSGNGHGNTVQQVMATDIQRSMEPKPSERAAHWQPQHKATLSGAEFASLSQASGLGINGVAPSALDQMHHGLVAPTPDQQGEQLFGMTPSQYSSLTAPDFHTRTPYGNTFLQPTPPMSEEESPPMHGRKNLAATLQRMHQASTGNSAAEVYTRSLLWDLVPNDVVREFKRIVDESSKLSDAQRTVKHEA